MLAAPAADLDPLAEEASHNGSRRAAAVRELGAELDAERAQGAQGRAAGCGWFRRLPGVAERPGRCRLAAPDAAVVVAEPGPPHRGRRGLAGAAQSGGERSADERVGVCADLEHAAQHDGPAAKIAA